MKDAYKSELQGLLGDIDSQRAKMEQWYALRLEDEQVVDQELTNFNDLMGGFEVLISKIGTSMRLVRNAIVPRINFGSGRSWC